MLNKRCQERTVELDIVYQVGAAQAMVEKPEAGPTIS